MKKLNLFLTLVICASASGVFSQTTSMRDSTQKKCLLKIVNASVYQGRVLQSTTDLSFADFQKLAPELNSFPSTGTLHYYTSGGGYNLFGYHVGANIGLQFNKYENSTRRFKPELRFGFNYSSGSNRLWAYVNNTETYRMDTISSANSVYSAYVDSVHYNNCFITQSTNQLRADASIIFRLEPGNRFSCYGGLGVDFGATLKSTTHLRYDSNSNIKYSATDSSSSSYITYSIPDYNAWNTEKTIVNKNGFRGSIYVPLGLDFRLGRKREFLKKIHLLYELRPAISFINIPEARTFASLGMKTTMGIKYYF